MVRTVGILLIAGGALSAYVGSRSVHDVITKLREEGVAFQTGVHVGVDLSPADLRRNFDAVLLCCGSEQARDLPIEGRELEGVHFAMEFLTANTRQAIHGDSIGDEFISAEGKDVIVIGGGDTGTDCIATSIRHGCRVQLDR